METTTSRNQHRLARRRANACLECRRKKLRCDHGQPCKNCQRSRRGVCSYDDCSPAARVSKPLGEDAVVDEPSRVDPRSEETETNQAPRDEAPQVKGSWHSSKMGRVLLAQSPAHDLVGPTSRAQDNAPSTKEETPTVIELLSNLPAPLKAVSTRSRYMLSSHWALAATLHPRILAWGHRHIEEDDDECCTLGRECKSLSDTINARMSVPRTPGQYGQCLPSTHLTKRLIDLYLQTFETTHRILHIPTFLAEYNSFTQNPNGTKTIFVIQLQLCLVLGACTYDEEFSLRQKALQWIQEVEDWMLSKEGRKTTIAKIQVDCLLQLARQATSSIWGDHTWIRSSALIPAAMSIGMHRDPAKLWSISPADAEMRRRLWTTVLELSLNAAVDAGQPALFSLDDFDCELPSNLNDDELDFDSKDYPVPKDPNQLTQTSAQIALGRSFAARLAIMKHSSKLTPLHDLQEAVRLGSELTAAAGALRSSLKKAEAPIFARHYCEMIISRYIFAHSLSYVAFSDPEVCSLRKTCVDTAFSVCHAALSMDTTQNDPLFAMCESAKLEMWCAEFKNLSICCTGIARSNLKTAICIVAAEACSIMAEQTMFRASRVLRVKEARVLLRAGVKLFEQRLKADTRDVIDYMYVSAALGQVTALMEEKDPEHAIAEHGHNALVYAHALLVGLVGDLADVSHKESGDLFDAGAWDLWATDYLDYGWTSFAANAING